MSEIEEAVERMRQYIETHLDQPISLVQLARVAGYSPYHTAHLFSRHLGESPLAYIRKCRLMQAALRLRDADEAILQVAFDYQFDSNEGFSRAFAKQFGMSPREYRKSTPPIPLFRPYLLTRKAQETAMETQTLYVQLVTRPARTAVIRRAVAAEEYFAYCEEVGCDVWSILCGIDEAINEPMGMWLPDSLIPKGTSKYVQGVEVRDDYQKPLPEGFEKIRLEPCTYMVFQSEPYDDADYESVIVNMQSAIERYRPENIGYRYDDTSPMYQLEPRGERGYIEARPVIEVRK